MGFLKSRRNSSGLTLLGMLFILGWSLSLPSGAQELTPLLHYQARLADATTGEALEGHFSMTFQIYEAESEGAAALWSEIKEVTATQGLVSTLLGDTEALDADLFDGRDLWLGISVGADAEASPRQRMAPVAYSLYTRSASHAQEANLLEGLGSDDFARAEHHHDTLYVNTTGPESITGNSFNPILTVSQTGGGIGGNFSSAGSHGMVGTTEGNFAGVSGVKGISGSPGGFILSKYGTLGLSDNGRGAGGFSEDNFGVYGKSTNSYGIVGEGGQNGVFGKALNDSGTAIGVKGQSSSSLGVGVFGENTSLSGATYGVRGVNQSGGGGAGVRGDSTNVGLWADST
jgi:trimeric autotransporter adhesin